jgi:hypothetical protein
MKVTLFTLPIAAAILFSSIPAEAHHSFSGTYDTSKTITIKGKIVRVSLRSPHAFFFVESEDSQGTAQEWAIEAASATQFAQQGITRDSFKVGDPVEIVANPARSTTLGVRARLIKITRTTDGKSWGSRPGETVQ